MQNEQNEPKTGQAKIDQPPTVGVDPREHLQDTPLLKEEDQRNAVEHPTKSGDESAAELNYDEAVDDMTEPTSKAEAKAAADQPADDRVRLVDTEKPKKEHHSLKEKIAQAYHVWWNNKRLRYATFAGAGTLLLVLGIVPPTRYFMLNTVGVRAQASIVVMDDGTDRPLKNVQVSLGSQTIKTDQSGKAQFSKVKLGRQQVVMRKRAFADKKQTVTIGWGSNPLGQVAVVPVGAQYVFSVTDWLSGKPISDVTATSGEYDATADKDGKLVLTIDANDDEDKDVTIASKDYRTETVKLDVSSKDATEVKMVARRKAVFVSKRSGRYDLYKIDVDGKNEQLVLAGSGNESDAIAIVPHPTAEITAFVSTRDTARNRDGYLLSTLNVIDLEDNSLQTVTQSEEIRILGWSGDRLIFIQVAAGASAPNPKRQRLVAYDYKKAQKSELASSNNFNDAQLVGSTVYYASGGYYNNGASGSLVSQKVEGTNKQNLLDDDVWNIFRSSYDKLVISGNSGWYDYKLGEAKTYRRAGAPNNIQDVQFVDSPDGKLSVWVEERDGKSNLLLRGSDTTEDRSLKAQAGLQAPIRWLDNHTLIYRIQTPSESADYVLNIAGGEAKKIRDVTRTTGIW